MTIVADIGNVLRDARNTMENGDGNGLSITEGLHLFADNAV